MHILSKAIIKAGKVFLCLIFIIIALEYGVRAILIARYKDSFKRFIAAASQISTKDIKNVSYWYDNIVVMDPICYNVMKGGFFRGPKGQFNPSEKEEDEIRIICVGDSTTFGVYLDYYFTYPVLLEKLLREKYPDKNIRVLNSGLPGASSRQLKRVFQLYLVNYEPDIVIWRKDTKLTDTYEITQISKQRIFLWKLLYKSKLLRVICIIADEVYPKTMSSFQYMYNCVMGVNGTEKPQYDFKSNFDIVKKIAFDNGVKHILAVDFIHNVSNERIRSDYQNCIRLGVRPLLITLNSFKQVLRSRKISDVFVDECHMTEIGTVIIASEVFKFIVNNGWVKDLHET